MRRLLFSLYAVVVLTRIEIGLRRGPLTDLCGRLGVRTEAQADDSPRSMSDEAWADLHRAAARGALVLRRWPFEDTCLRRCLLLGAVMRDESPVLALGVKRGDDGKVAAHSWLVLGGRSIDPTSGEFAPLGLR